MAMEGAIQANMHLCSWGAFNYTLLHRVPKLLSHVFNSITAVILHASQIGQYINMAGQSILHEHWNVNEIDEYIMILVAD